MPRDHRPSLTTRSGLLAAIALGLATGSVATEGAILVPWWRTLPPADFLAWYARNTTRLFNYFGTLEMMSAALATAAAGLGLLQRAAGTRQFAVAAMLSLVVLALFP